MTDTLQPDPYRCSRCNGSGRLGRPLSFGERVRDARADLNMPQAHLAAAIGRHPSLVCRIEKGKSIGSPETVTKIKAELGLE